MGGASVTRGKDSEVKSLISLTTNSEGSTLATSRGRWKNAPLHERCTTADMLKIQDVFRAAYREKLLPGEFRSTLRNLLNVEYDDEEFKILFMKINTNRNGEIEWDELVSHLLLGYFGSDAENQRETLQLPIVGFPVVLRSHHRHPISRICFSPDVNKDRTTDNMQGTYVTASRDGAINWWTLDMRLLRTTYSTSPHLKVRTTWVTDMACMPDVNIVVTSSTERDLRFYDCTAGTFTLKIVIYSWEYMISTMHYHFHKDINENNMLVCGDAGGHLRVLLFSPVQRGPFQNSPGRSLIQIRHLDLQKRSPLLPEMKLVEIRNAHSQWIRQVSYYPSLHCLVSCSTSPDSMLMSDLAGNKTHNVFRVDKGIQCFAFDDTAHVLVSGGPDCAVRVWSPFVTARPNFILRGHRDGVVAIILQDNASRIYSLSRSRIIKVWDVYAQVCLQSYIDIPPTVGERSLLSAAYNPASRELFLAANAIAIVLLDEQLNPKHTDGFTHSRAISAVLYNPLFKVLITCGLDSIIICWDPLSGKRNAMVRDAHTRPLHGELVPIEITTACFDPGYQLLLTGARDGTLKVWNFNTGVSLKTMSIEHNCEVTSVFWVEGRIMAVGWNRHVTEFEDTGTATTGKDWEVRHSDDVLAAVSRPPLTLVTASYNSELVMWKLETGQPYRRFSCMSPTERIKMHYSKRDLQRGSSSPGHGAGDAARSRATVIRKPSMGGAARSTVIEPAEAMSKARARRESPPVKPQRVINMRSLAIHAMIFLQSRPYEPNVAALMVAIENGQVQCWSDHPGGGYKGSFQATHTAGDYVAAFTTDEENRFLFTGTTVGYVKVWLMANYLIGEEVHVNMPALRLEFPFLWSDRVEGRAKRCVRDQPLPVLLNSYRAHLRRITSMAYIDERKLLFTGSSDYSVRVWRLSGEYLQTLGGFVPWTLDETRFPPDVNKVVSSTTLKVWRHGEASRYTPGVFEMRQRAAEEMKDVTERELRTDSYGQRAEEPLLGGRFQLPRRPDRQDRIMLDDSLPTIPIYRHLRMASTQPVRRPATPELVRETRLGRAHAKKTHFGRTSTMPDPEQQP